MEEIVKVSWFMKGETPREKAEEFFKEYVDDGYIQINEYIDGIIEQTGESVLVIQFSTLRSTYDLFVKEFGNYTTIREGWDMENKH